MNGSNLKNKNKKEVQGVVIYTYIFWINYLIEILFKKNLLSELWKKINQLKHIKQYVIFN